MLGRRLHAAVDILASLDVNVALRLNILEHTLRWTNYGLMLGQRRRRWPNIKPLLVQRSVHAGILA